mmetsp:Transcript_27209/g.39421  ORF Transcript_27209/g.39421 Transcript_27209/m.39421 type:complete len:319 (+) Transcript_27209:606-1562(+)
MSYICIAADDAEQAYDCLSSSAKPLTRIRQDTASSNIFYLERTTQVVVQDLQDIQYLLQTGSVFERIELNEKRVHRLITFTVYKCFTNGDVVSFVLQAMDLSGADRPTNTTTQAKGGTTTAAQRRQQPQRLKTRPLQRKNKEDKTLRAISRIIDGLSNGDQHIPYRDSKLTRLACRGFEYENDTTINLAVIGISAVEESMYDEACAMMEFGKKIRSIDSKKKENKKTGTGAGISLTNRVNDLNSAKERVMNLSDKCGYPTNTEQKLTSSDIQLDMSSSMDLVELRDALVQVEILEVDPILEMTEKSHLWWKERDRKNE